MPEFSLVSRRPVTALQATLEHYVDHRSGAQHLHLATQDEELAFLVAFPTVPDRSDGRAHILEHLALSGSQRYPIANPFFSMMRRSTATFMNAMTYSDRTVYPFASTDEKDFFNLLDVYLDATFFPELDPLGFLQEGWRYTLDNGQLGLQGVVFNEMKGVYNDPLHVLSVAMRRELFQGTTYAVDSGGDPAEIPSISHAILKAFHASHYHPSQAVFMTAGRVAAAQVQARISERVLVPLTGVVPRHMPTLAVPWTAPRRIAVALPPQGTGNNEQGVQIAWLLGEATDPLATHLAQILTFGLLGSASAPVMQAMQSAGFGRPSRMTGLDQSARQMVLHLGMEGLTQSQVEPAEECIRDALRRAARDGVPAEVIKAALRNLRVDQREVPSGSMPAGLVRLLNAVPMVMLGGDAMTALDVEPLLVELDEQANDPGFFKGLVQALLDNPTCLVTHATPDSDFFGKRVAAEQALLHQRQAQLTPEDRARILSESAALAERQQRIPDAEVLPRILPQELKPAPRALPGLTCSADGTCAATVASNGITYANVIYDVGSFEEADWPWLRLYADLLPELGVGSQSYAEASAWRQGMVPAFRVAFDALSTADGGLKPQLSLFASALREEQEAIVTVMQSWVTQPRFDETDRIAFLVTSRVRSQISGLGQLGSQYAALTATAPLSVKTRFENRVRGTESFAFCNLLQGMIETADGLAEVCQRLAFVQARLLACPRTILCAGSDADGAKLAHSLAIAIPAPRAAASAESAASGPDTVLAQAALDIAGQVNHCVAAWSVPSMTHVDAAALAVTAELLGNQILHRLLREQGGAYGASASYSGDTGIFMMSSFRDPRLAATYADFAAAVETVAHSDFSTIQIEEAIVCVIKRLDKPQAPHVEALLAWQLMERGISVDARARFRQRVLACTGDDIKRVTRAWLAQAAPSRAAAAGNLTQDLAGLSPVNLLESP
ncbi:insulinase family protein [Ramlibacter sp. WS9]|uniref:insulinase family protein n=1 Tax=Ramlibacter sp. WS9 TaxID=1882741 RepID=UPI00114308B2|nr:insulinase family protein [Ramlibacter sp. WS9]ROZ78133.1 peptidase M16 [Ramlibacter sp. WS9]